MTPRAKKAVSGSVVLEVSPRVAKLMVAGAAPVHIQRVAASTLPEPSDDPVGVLRALLGAHPLGGVREVGLLIGREAFSLRTLELPSTDAKEIASMLELQLGKLTPYPRAEILSAWSLIGSAREGYTTVLLAVTRKVLVNEVLQALKLKGVSPRWVGVSTEGLEAWWSAAARSAPPLAEGQLLALLDVDFASTDCAVLSRNGQLLFTHSIAIGADQLAASEPAKLRWVGELVRVPRILIHEEIKGRIGRGLVTGVTEGLATLVEQLTTQWGVTIEVADSLKSFAPSSLVSQSIAANRVSYTALAGLATAAAPPRIDLIPTEMRLSQALQLRSRHLARLAGSLAALLICFAILYGERIVMLRLHLGQVQRELTAVEASAQQVLQRQALMRKTRDWLNPARSPLEVFRSIADAIDADVAVTQISLEDGKPVKIYGKARTTASAAAFAKRLETKGPFSKVTPHPTLKSTTLDAFAVEFEMLCEWAGS